MPSAGTRLSVWARPAEFLCLFHAFALTERIRRGNIHNVPIQIDIVIEGIRGALCGVLRRRTGFR